MSLKYRGGVGDHKLLIELADTTPGFLTAKLLVGTGLTKTIQNPAGNENILLAFDATGFGDPRYIKRSPSGENQTILPLTDNVPLTIRQFLGGVSNLFQVQDSTGTNLLLVDSAGNLVLTKSVPSVKLIGTEAGGVERRLRENAGNVELTDAAGTVLRTLFPLPVLTPTVVDTTAGAVGTSTLVSPSDHKHALNNPLTGPVSIANIIGSGFTLRVGTSFSVIALDIDNTGLIEWYNTGTGVADIDLRRAAQGALVIDIPPGGPLGQQAMLLLLGNEAGAANRGLRENAGNLEVITNPVTPTVLVQLNPLTSLTPVAVNATGQAAGTSIQIPHADHVHQFASPITGAVSIIPSSDVVPLTLKGFPTGVSDVFEVFDSTSPTQVLRWKITSGGFLISNDARIDVFRGAVPNAAYQAFVTGEANPRLIIYPNPNIEMGPGGASAPDVAILRGAAGIIKIAQGFNSWPAGTLAQLALQGVEVGNLERRVRENSGAVEVTDTVPTVLRSLLLDVTPATVFLNGTAAIGTSTAYSRGDHVHIVSQSFGANFFDQTNMATPAAPALNVRRVFVVSTRNQVCAETSAGTVVYLEGRGAPNVAVAKAATSLTITLSPAEPDTSYEIGTTLAFNSTAFYSAKATTGFTINFGTAPGAASQLDWTVDRRVSGAA